MTKTKNNGPAVINHVADFNNRYPGEVVTFFTRLEAHEELAGLALRVSLPHQLMVGDFSPPRQRPQLTPQVEVGSQASYVVWNVEAGLAAGESLEFQTEAVVAPTRQNLTLESRAALVTTGENELLADERARLAVWTQGKYLNYLPAVYQKDDMMGRFLMLFESFWKPIEVQVDSAAYYFDPRTAPIDFLPWLASWLDLELDERWPEERLRLLIRWAIALHRSRGTRWGLLKYLEIYTGRQAKVIEKISNNFVLGPEATLGPSIALGRGNVPHTFTVELQLPPLDINDRQERQRQEKIRRRTIESIIEMQKPAHTLYTLNLEIVTDAELQAEADAAARTAASEEPIDEIAIQAATWFKLDDE